MIGFSLTQGKFGDIWYFYNTASMKVVYPLTYLATLSILSIFFFFLISGTVVLPIKFLDVETLYAFDVTILV